MNLTVAAYEALLRANPDLHAPDLPRPRRGLAPTEHEEQAARRTAWAAKVYGDAAEDMDADDLEERFSEWLDLWGLR